MDRGSEGVKSERIWHLVWRQWWGHWWRYWIDAKRIGYVTVIVLGVASLSSGDRVITKVDTSRRSPAFAMEIEDAFMIESTRPQQVRGCKAMIDGYCSQLHSSKAKGNLKIEDRDNPFVVIQGETTNNFDAPTFAFYRSSLDNRRALPADLRAGLEERGFYRNLRLLLDRPPRRRMTLRERIAFSDMEARVENDWEQALDEVVLERLSKKYPNAHAIEDSSLPREIELEKWRIRYRLWSEISNALWSKHMRWKRAEAVFRDLQEAFVKVIQALDVPEELRAAWSAKVRSVRLSVPGYSPVVANQDCISTARNAFYYPYLNTITVCAGYFNGGDQIQTLAHELAHAIDFSTRLIDFQQSSALVGEMQKLRQNLCRVKEFTCEGWASFKQSYSGLIERLSGFQPDLPNFQQCLKKASTPRLISGTDLDKVADKIVRQRYSDMVKNASFFRITKSRVPLPSGETIKNASHLNPCGYNLWDLQPLVLDSESVSLMLFTASYRCADTPESQRIRDAVQESRAMTQQLMRSLLALEGQFSARELMQEEDLSSPPNERFADRMGSYIVSEYLKDKVPEAQRKSAFLASSFWLCSKPSLKTQYYDEYQALGDIIIDRTVHPENEERIKDWLSPTVRDSLSCEFDFQHNECDLPRRPSVSEP